MSESEHDEQRWEDEGGSLRPEPVPVVRHVTKLEWTIQSLVMTPRAKAGKSWFAADLAQTLSDGKSWLR